MIANLTPEVLKGENAKEQCSKLISEFNTLAFAGEARNSSAAQFSKNYFFTVAQISNRTNDFVDKILLVLYPNKSNPPAEFLWLAVRAREGSDAVSYRRR